MSGGDWKDFFLAAKSGNTERVQFHIKQGINLDYQHPEVMTTALLESVRQNQLKVAALLLDNGASLDIVDEWEGETAISLAKELKKTEMLALLEGYLGR